jgi:hypothetical protein
VKERKGERECVRGMERVCEREGETVYERGRERVCEREGESVCVIEIDREGGVY